MVGQVGRLLKQPAPKWIDATPTAADVDFLRKEATGRSPFDPLHLKRTIWDEYHRGNLQIVCKECPVLRVVALVPSGVQIPCEDWGRLAQWGYGNSTNKRNTVYWFGAAAARRFPERGAAITSAHVNGGYTHGCSSSGIVIYRLEEATRVFIHEMLHALCMDPPVASIPYRESFIETWAELFLVAYRSRGSIAAAEHLWRLQSQWVADQNWRAEAEHGVVGPAQYGWRYLNGRAAIYQSLGCELPTPRKWLAQTRFTHPALDKN